MRLTTEQINLIRDAAQSVFGPEVRVFLFGSRTDDSLRGGDIDLMIQTDPRNRIVQTKIRFLAALQRTLGDRRIDVVFHRPGQPFIRAIQSRAIPLWT